MPGLILSVPKADVLSYYYTSNKDLFDTLRGGMIGPAATHILCNCEVQASGGVDQP